MFEPPYIDFLSHASVLDIFGSQSPALRDEVGPESTVLRRIRRASDTLWRRREVVTGVGEIIIGFIIEAASHRQAIVLEEVGIVVSFAACVFRSGMLSFSEPRKPRRYDLQGLPCHLGLRVPAVERLALLLA